MHTCKYCDENINEIEGDDKIAFEDGYYHFECLCEMMDDDGDNFLITLGGQ